MLKLINRILMATIILLMVGTSCENKKINNKFANTDIPIINFKVNNEVVSFLVDTGAEVSIIDKDYYCKNESIFSVIDTIKYLSITPTHIDTLENVRVNSAINDSIEVVFRCGNINNAIKVMSYMSNRNVIGILGYDFIKNNNLIIDFENKKIVNL